VSRHEREGEGGYNAEIAGERTYKWTEKLKKRRDQEEIEQVGLPKLEAGMEGKGGGVGVQRPNQESSSLDMASVGNSECSLSCP
jgi:hypothetical protein